MNRKKPLISVIMPVYNAEKFISEAIESILNQTYKNIEFIIIDDASTDNSLSIIKKYAVKHNNIVVLQNGTNHGISKTVMRAISITKGEYIARMDADDVSMPNRLEKQINYLIAHKNTVAVGTQCLLIDKDSRVIGKKTFPTKFSDIYKYIYHFVPLQQPSLMIAKRKLPDNFVYYVDGMNTAEEIELIFKLFTYGKVENLKDTLLMYRMHDTNTSFKNIKETFLLTLIARIKAIFVYGYKPNISGVFATFLQASLVLILPQYLTLFLYKVWRNKSINQFFVFSPRLIPFEKTLTSI